MAQSVQQPTLLSESSICLSRLCEDTRYLKCQIQNRQVLVGSIDEALVNIGKLHDNHTFLLIADRIIINDLLVKLYPNISQNNRDDLH